MNNESYEFVYTPEHLYVVFELNQLKKTAC